MSGTGKAVKIEWFFDSAAFHYEPDKAVLGLLRVFEDGSAEMTADGRQTFKRFDDAEEAGEWLTDEEFSPLDILAGAAQDEAVTPPDAAALKAQMETLLKAVK